MLGGLFADRPWHSSTLIVRNNVQDYPILIPFQTLALCRSVLATPTQTVGRQCADATQFTARQYDLKSEASNSGLRRCRCLKAESKDGAKASNHEDKKRTMLRPRNAPNDGPNEHPKKLNHQNLFD